jgi:hypothetical protein
VLLASRTEFLNPTQLCISGSIGACRQSAAFIRIPTFCSLPHRVQSINVSSRRVSLVDERCVQSLIKRAGPMECVGVPPAIPLDPRTFPMELDSTDVCTIRNSTHCINVVRPILNNFTFGTGYLQHIDSRKARHFCCCQHRFSYAPPNTRRTVVKKLTFGFW